MHQLQFPVTEEGEASVLIEYYLVNTSMPRNGTTTDYKMSSGGHSVEENWKLRMIVLIVSYTDCSSNVILTKLVTFAEIQSKVMPYCISGQNCPHGKDCQSEEGVRGGCDECGFL